MGFLNEKIASLPDEGVKRPAVEFYSPKTRQRDTDTISPTRSPWDAYTKREIIENHPVDNIQIRQGLQVDGFIRTAVSKYQNSVFLRGYKIQSLKPSIERYLAIRLQLIVDAMPDHNHLDDFLQSIAHDLIAYANVYVLKQRRKQPKLPGGLNIQGVPRVKPGGKDSDRPRIEPQDPIVSYELLHPASIHIIRDINGNTLRYEQWRMFDKVRPDKKNMMVFQPDEIIHIKIDCEDNTPYGIPFLAAVLDDVRILRSIEDHASRLTYRFAFPFTQVKVGIPQPGMMATEEDLTFYRDLITNAPPDATLTTSEKVSFEVVGAQGSAIELGPYLTYFKSRAFAGLGVSGVAMGEGDSANRSTADAMTTNMHDQIKHFQNVLARNINQEIFRELLLEGGFDWYADPQKNWARILFEEIEVEAQIKREAHFLSLLQANAITFTEFRILTGRQPFTDSQWDDTYLLKFLLPQDVIKLTGIMDLDQHGKLILEKHKADMDISKSTIELNKANVKSIDAHTELTKKTDPPEQNSDMAHQTITTGKTVHQIPGKSKKVSITKSVKSPVALPGSKGPKASAKTTAKATDNKNRPANQHGKRLGPKRSTEQTTEGSQTRSINISTGITRYLAQLEELYSNLQEAAYEQTLIHRNGSFDRESMIKVLFNLTQERATSLSRRYLHPAFNLGVQKFNEQAETNISDIWISEHQALIEYNERTIRRLIGDLSRGIGRLIERKNVEDLKEEVANLFQKHEYRLNLIAQTELPQAYWFGYASGAQLAGKELDLERENDACEDCLNSKFENSSSARKRLASAPTRHPQCNCGLTLLALDATSEENS